MCRPTGVRSLTRMSRAEILPFDESHLADAGRLLAERHRRHRVAEPLLSPRFEEVTAATAEVTSAWRADDASGAVASHEGRVVGFLLGSPKPSDVWGPNVWVEAAGQASDEPELMRDLYAAAATRWVDEGRTAHYVLTPAHDTDLVRAWFRLGFGHQHSHALRHLPTGPVPTPPQVVVRRAARGDVPALARLDLELPAHQGLSPVFSAGHVSTYDEALAEWEDVDDPEFATFVAEHGGRVIGSAVGCALEKSSAHGGLTRPDRAGYLSFAAVFPDARGHGAGRALGEAVLGWCADAGHSCVATDWRVTNLLSSRTWPALGFAETFLRLHRVVGY